MLEENPETDLDQKIREIEKLHKSERKIPEENFYAIYSEDTLEGILNQIDEECKYVRENLDDDQKDNAKYYIDRTLILLDDQVGSSLFSNRKGHNPFVQLNVRHRHYSVSMMIVSQAYMELPKTVRINLTAWILFDIPNDREVETIWEEHSCGLKFDLWYELYQHAVSEPYSFLYLNEFFPKGRRLYKRFESCLSYKPESIGGAEKHPVEEEQLQPVKNKKRRV